MKFQRTLAVLVASLVTLAMVADTQAKGRKSSGKSSGRSRSSSNNSFGKSFSNRMKSNSGFKGAYGNAKKHFGSSKKFTPKMNSKGGHFKGVPNFKQPSFKKPNFKKPINKTMPIKGVPNFKNPNFKKPNFKKPINKTLPFPGKIGKNLPIKGVPDFKKPNFKNPKFKKPNFKKPINKVLPFPVKIGKGVPHFKHKNHGNHWRRKPRHCWWWYDYCRPLHHCEPIHYNYCDWNYVRCDYVVGGQTVVQEARWYLGVKGMILPGKGLGIEEVAAGSPAALAGLSTGMVIQQANGIDLVDEAALATAIQQSNGALSLVVVNEANGQSQQATVQMTRLVAVSY